MDDYQFWIEMRHALLLAVDIIERRWQLPRTSRRHHHRREREESQQE